MWSLSLEYTGWTETRRQIKKCRVPAAPSDWDAKWNKSECVSVGDMLDIMLATFYTSLVIKLSYSALGCNQSNTNCFLWYLCCSQTRKHGKWDFNNKMICIIESLPCTYWCIDFWCILVLMSLGSKTTKQITKPWTWANYIKMQCSDSCMHGYGYLSNNDSKAVGNCAVFPRVLSGPTLCTRRAILSDNIAPILHLKSWLFLQAISWLILFCTQNEINKVMIK